MALRGRRFAVVLLAALAFAVLGSPSAHAEAPASPVKWHRDTKDPRWVQGQVTVDAAPDVVWARMQRVHAWPTMLTDINRMRVTEHKDSRWKIELETRTIPYGMLGYDVELLDTRQVKVWTDRLGVKVSAQTDVQPGPTPKQSIVTYSFFIEVSGIPKLLISAEELRAKQEHMVQVTLEDFYRAFQAPAP
jgi:uncharacterized membrane protein